MSNNNKQQKAQIGKGIGALLGNIKHEINTFNHTTSATTKASVGNILRIPIEQIVINPKQPRTDFDETTLRELSESIKLHDIIQPITVIKLPNATYQIIAGERRFRASKLAGLKDIPAYIRTANDQELLEMALLENLQRENLNAIEIGLSYKRLMDECALTQEQVAERMKKERSTVTNYIRLLKLPPVIQLSVRNGNLSMGHARALLGVAHIDQQLYVFNQINEAHLSVRATEELCKKINTPDNKNKTPQKNHSIPPAYKRIETQLASHLSTKIILDRQKSGKGVIHIEFYNDEDLERIMDKMNL